LVVDTTDYVDNGANFILNAGQRWLDRKLDHKYSVGRLFKQVSAGNVGVTFQLCRVILQVWIQDTTEGNRTLLEKKSPTWLRENYYSSFGDTTQYMPLYYYPAYLRVFPHNPTLADLQMYLGFADVSPMLPDDVVYDGVIFMPPADSAYTVEVWGHFYSPELTSDTQSSYWSVRNPEMLLMAGMRMLEVFKRNSEGVKDWEAAVKEQLADVDKDAADEDVTDIDQMEG